MIRYDVVVATAISNIYSNGGEMAWRGVMAARIGWLMRHLSQLANNVKAAAYCLQSMA